jgi:hypothetical protein
MKNKIVILTLINIFIILGVIFASPSLPHTFTGDIIYLDDPNMSLQGYKISASIPGWEIGIIGEVDANNSYEILVDPQGHSGLITFYIGGAEAIPTEGYEWGGYSELDLTIEDMPINSLCGNNIQETGEQCDSEDLSIGTCENVLGIPGSTGTLSCTDSCTFAYSNCSAPYCGDGTCNNGETCTTCSGDCGACPSSGGGGSSGGGSSGGGSSGGSSSVGSSSTIANNSVNSTTQNTTFESSENSENTNLETEEEEKIISKIMGAMKITGSMKKITGAVIGNTKTKIGIGIIIAIIILIIGTKIILHKKEK